MRGEVLSYDHSAGTGLISGDDGVRYRFSRAGLVRPEPPAPGDQVDFIAQGDTATDLVVLSTSLRPETPWAPARRTPELDGWAYFTRCMTRLYFQGEGRARRSEFWWYQLFHWLVFIGVSVVIFFLGGVLIAAMGADTDQSNGAFALIGSAWMLVVLGFIVPSITVLVRRLHDMGQSGFWVFISIVPFGGLALFIMTLMPSDPGPNRYGPHPL